MFLENYLSIDESLCYVQKGVDEKSSIKRSAKTIIKNAIDLLELKPVFKFAGYAILFKTVNDRTSKNSIEYKQVCRLSGYFYDSSVFYPRDYETSTHFSNLDESFFHSSEAIVDELVDSICITTHYLKNIYDNDGYHSHLDRDSKIKAFDFEPNEYLTLSSKRPVFSDFHQENRCAVQVPRENVFFKINELDYIINSFQESNSKIEFSLNEENMSLQTKNEKLSKRIDYLEQQLSTTLENEGQGDSLLILGAVMNCVVDIAKLNYTQQALIDAILSKYGNITGISESTLKKKFAESKKDIKQRLI